jgi:hypothetical protein
MLEEQRIRDQLDALNQVEYSDPFQKGPSESSLNMLQILVVALCLVAGIVLNLVSKKVLWNGIGSALILVGLIMPIILRPMIGKLSVERLKARRKNIEKSLFDFNSQYMYGRGAVMKCSEFGAYIYLEKNHRVKKTEVRPLVCGGVDNDNIGGYKDVGGDSDDVPVVPVRKQTTVIPNQSKL